MGKNKAHGPIRRRRRRRRRVLPKSYTLQNPHTQVSNYTNKSGAFDARSVLGVRSTCIAILLLGRGLKVTAA